VTRDITWLYRITTARRLEHRNGYEPPNPESGKRHLELIILEIGDGKDEKD
jgi:hypothetical protein